MHAPRGLAVKYYVFDRYQAGNAPEPLRAAAGPRPAAAAAAPEQHLSNASFVTGTATCRQYRGPRPLGARRGQQGRQKGLEGAGELRLRARVIGRRGSHHVSARLGAEKQEHGDGVASDADADASAEDGAAVQRGPSLVSIARFGLSRVWGPGAVLPCPASRFCPI